MLYFSVTALELAPVVLEKYGFEKWIGLLHKASIPIVIVGITLSSLHHTSLGSLFLVMPARLHELWFTGWLPWLFILSAVGAGIFMVILVTLGYSFLYRRDSDLPMLGGLSKAAAVILGLYLILKLADLWVRGSFTALISGEWEAGFFWTEIVLAAVLPIVLVAIPKSRKSAVGLALAATSAVSGLVLNRLNVGVTGLLRTADAGYFPTLSEVGLSLGVIAMAGLALLFLVENFCVFEDAPARRLLEPGTNGVGESGLLGRALAFAPVSRRARLSLLVVVTASIGIGVFSAQAFEGMPLEQSTVRPPTGVTEARTILLIDGDRDGDGVLFPHEALKTELGGEQSCQKCHHLDLPGDKSSACHRCHSDMQRKTSIFKHESHVAALDDKWSCEKCHDSSRPKNLDNSKACHECHAEDMGLTPPASGRYDFHARSYTDAMHGLCVKCHEELDQKAGETRLAECRACHGDREQSMLMGESNQ
jgi:hypothetical protein